MLFQLMCELDKGLVNGSAGRGKGVEVREVEVASELLSDTA